jgi:hypothetical protein
MAPWRRPGWLGFELVALPHGCSGHGKCNDVYAKCLKDWGS